MRKWPAIESLESRTLLSGNALDQPDDINHRATQQLQSAYAIGNASGIPTTTYAAPHVAVSSATTSATQFMSASESSALPPPPPGPPVISAHGPLLVSPKVYGGTGGIVMPPTPPEVHTSDRDSESAPIQAPPAGPTSLNVPTSAKSIETNPGQPASSRNAESAGFPAMVDAEPWIALDACFADDAWALPIDLPFPNAPSAEASQTSELDLLVTALGMAATVQIAHGESNPREQREQRAARTRLGQS